MADNPHWLNVAKPVNKKTTVAFTAPSVLYIGWRDVTVIYGHDTISMLWGMMSYSSKLTGENVSRYFHKIESTGLRKA